MHDSSRSIFKNKNCDIYILHIYCLLNDKKRSKNLVQGLYKTFRLSSHTPEQFNIMSIEYIYKNLI